ncbi:dATP/dGTP diphosphohydrolase domain-containing protein [uncultured Ruegeria sp.]|uniref:dATP/dGTP diphosphohydrolase domain-containing protein n=1 Tax=uncultured Ruegeria sp. TaxID=259304 RepID=UPI002630A568|nr:dATP/dGTP diphosphohydrolase domain-containing protein [uncultured Ruegeria sp.]
MAQTEMTGRKDDSAKVRMELLPPELLTATADILTFGAEKYDARNWEKGMEWGRVYGALQRHLNAWWSGVDTDDETGKSHLHHAACCVAFLLTYEARGIGKDDRP